MRMYVYILPSFAVHVKKAALGRTLNFPNFLQEEGVAPSPLSFELYNNF